MATWWVSEAWPLGGSLDGFLRHGHWMDGILRHGHWVGFRGMAAGWVTGWVSEAWLQGHWMGFSGMATWLVLDSWLLGHWMGLPLARVLEDFRGGVPSWSTPYTLVGLRMPKTLIIVLLLHNF